MTKFQKERIAKEYKSLNQKYDKLEDKLSEAVKEGDTEKANRYEERIENVLGKMEGIQFVLKTFGCYVEWNMKDDSYFVKNEN